MLIFFINTKSKCPAFNFDLADIDGLFQQFDYFEAEANRFLEAGLPLPAYEYVMKASHCFNLLDARSRNFGHRAPTVYFESPDLGTGCRRILL